jgi:sigma-B regulation protein RsbQ
MSIYQRNNIHVQGAGTKTMVLAHGFGCDQNMWRFIVPAFLSDYRVVLFDHVGAGKSDVSQYRRDKYESLEGYADDVLEIIDAVGGAPVVFVGHSVSGMIGILAAAKRPSAFERLILIGPSPCYINGPDYVGGFNKSDIEALLATLDSNYLGWSSATAPVIMGNADRPELAGELTESFCRTNPDIAKHFARVTFLSDNRHDLAQVRIPALVMQCSEDAIAPDSVGQFVHDHLPQSKLVHLSATGHCPHMSAPEETIAAMRQYLSSES